MCMLNHRCILPSELPIPTDLILSGIEAACGITMLFIKKKNLIDLIRSQEKSEKNIGLHIHKARVPLV